VTEPLQVGQFAIVDHEPVDCGPNGGIFHGKGPAGDRAELFVVAEGTTPAGEAFAGHVVSAIGQLVAQLDLSLTGTLRHAFAEAARNVLDWNRKSIAQHRVALGLSVFARRGHQAVIAQAGPSTVFHLRQGAVRAHVPDEGHAAPVGSLATAEPQLTRIEFGPGDRVLLLSTAALRYLDEEAIEGILRLPGEQALRELYYRVREARNVTVLLVEHPAAPEAEAEAEGAEVVIDATGGDASGRAPGGETAIQPSLFFTDDQHEWDLARARRQLEAVAERTRARAAIRQPEVQVLVLAAGDEAFLSRVEESRARASAARAALVSLALGAAKSVQTGAGGSGRGAGGRVTEGRASFARSLVPERLAPKPEPPASDAPLCEELAASQQATQRTTSAAYSVSFTGEGGFRARPLVRPRRRSTARWRSHGAIHERGALAAPAPPTWLVVAVGLAILVSLFSFVFGPSLFDSSGGQRWEDLVDLAQQKLAAAEVQADPAARRQLLQDAQALLLQAREAAGTNAGLEQWIARAREALAAMDAIRTPAAVEQIGDLSTFGDRPVTPSHLTITSTDAYLLDTASGRVIRQPLTGDLATAIYSEDPAAGLARPIAVTLAEGPGFAEPTLLIFDASRRLWGFTPSSGALQPILFALPPGANLYDLDWEAGTLFGLDPAAGAVYAWTATDGAFGEPPREVLKTPDLAGARRLAVIDSEIYTTDANGTVRRFSGQLSLTLSQAGIDTPLVNPAPAQPFGEGQLAFADPAAGRVVVLRSDGTFDHQYRHPEFQAVSALATGRDGTGYVFANGQLWRVRW
jgi:hypothetical protein